MWPDQAAAAAQLIWSEMFSDFEDPVPWDELKENITQGNVAGSGYGYTLLHGFVKKGNELAVKFLLYKGADIDAVSRSNGYTPLHIAIESHNCAMVSLLLENGADPLAPDAKEMTAFARAISLGDEPVVRAILAHGTDVNCSVAEGGITLKPLMLAIEYGRERIVELLIEKGAQMEAMDGNGNTGLIKAVGDERRIQIVERLLKSGANVNANNHHGVTPLMVAVKSGSEKLVNILLEKRPNLEARTKEGETALFIASKEGYISIVKSLLSCGTECVVGYPRGATPQDVASCFAILEALQQARTHKKKWYQRLQSDKMDEKYRLAKLAKIYKEHEAREMKERREFSYIPEDESDEEERRLMAKRGLSRPSTRLGIASTTISRK